MVTVQHQCGLNPRVGALPVDDQFEERTEQLMMTQGTVEGVGANTAGEVDTDTRRRLSVGRRGLVDSLPVFLACSCPFRLSQTFIYC